MLVLSLAARSLRNRLLTTALTLLSIAVSVALLVGVENVRVGMRESFSNTIRGTDLIVGARGGTMQLLLYSVFGMGSPAGNISYASYERWRDHPAVAWTIPYSLGDSHRGFRVVGTTGDFYERYRFRRDGRVTFAAGRAPAALFDVALGSEVAARLGYGLGDAVVVTHGMRGTGIMDHDDTPFRVVGILNRTSTPIDRSVYVTLEGVKAIHLGWEEGAPPAPGASAPAAASGAPATLTRDQVDVDQITSFFLGTRSRFEALRLQREINTDDREAMTAIIPGVALGEMWRAIGYAEDGVRVITIFVVVVGLLGMLVALYSSLDARRREMAILRAVGAGPRRVVSLLVLESGLLAVLGSVLGVLLVYALLFSLQDVVERRFGLYLPIRPLGTVEYAYVALVVVTGFLVGLVPAAKAYRNTLADGLSVRV
jgi:putative ABC transport system permease protein